MSAAVWIVGDALSEVAAGLVDAGTTVHRIDVEEMAATAAHAYDGGGLLLVDATSPAGLTATTRVESALLPVLVFAEPDADIPAGLLRVNASLPDATCVHHVLEVLNEPANLRRHPRVPVQRPTRIGTSDGSGPWLQTTTHDASLYGLRLSPAPDLVEGQELEVRMSVSGGAEVCLSGRVVARRGVSVAVRCRPITDEDLLLWIHLLLDHLSESPLHAEQDPFATLFEAPSGEGSGRPND